MKRRKPWNLLGLLREVASVVYRRVGGRVGDRAAQTGGRSESVVGEANPHPDP